MNIPRLPASRLSTLEEGYSEQEEVPTDQVPQAESKEVVRSTIYPQRTESVKKRPSIRRELPIILL